MHRVNLDGAFLTCRAVVPGMVAAGWGRIVLLASVASTEGNAGQSAYSSSKAAGSAGLIRSLDRLFTELRHTHAREG